ncbi:MAG: 6-phosphogluconolactonase [Verrucomicrobiales bacterium]|jgi:6-phosphogluconolactonase
MKTIHLLTSSIFLAFSAQLFAEPIDVYFGTGGRESKGIYRATFDPENGKLTSASLAAEIKGPGFLASHPDGTKIYAVAAIEGGPGVAGFHVKDDGQLEQFTTSLIGDGGAAHVAIHPSGKFLMTAQYGGGSAGFFPIDADGKLGDAVVHEHEGGSKVVENRQDSPHPHWCGFSPDGKFAFVPDLGTDNIHIYKVDVEKPAIAKHGLAQSIPGGGPRHMRFSVDGKFIYLLNELTLSVSTFAYNAEEGSAKLLTTTPALSEEVKAKEGFNSSAEILVHPNGKFVWSSNRGNDSITCYRADPKTGKLTVTEVEPIRGAWPRNINIDPTSQWVLAAGANSSTVSVHKIDQETGELSYLTRGIINVPGPICILFAK